MPSGLGIIDEEALNIFTDGSSFPDRQRVSGIGVRFVWVNESGDEETEDLSPPGWSKATIDEMEIQACIFALKEARKRNEIATYKRVVLFSDSRYVTDNFSNALFRWPKRKWLGANGMPIANVELWKEFRKLVDNFPVRVDVEWVKAHKKNLHNKAADKLAKQSADYPINKPLKVNETAKKWSDRKTLRGSVNIDGRVAKIRIISRKYLKAADTHEYRYEIIDPVDRNFRDIDFVYCDEYLSRHKCLLVRFNSEPKKPFIEEVIKELDCKDYRY